MQWKPRIRADADLLRLPLDPQRGHLLFLLDGSLDLDQLASVTGLEPDRVEAMVAELVAMGALEPGPGPAPEPGPALTQRSLFEQRLHHRPEEERADLARRAVEPELSAYCFDPVAKVILALLQNPRAGLAHARLIAANHRTSAGLEALAGNAALAADSGVRRALLQNPVLPASLFRRLWGPQRLQEQYLVAVSHEVPEQTRALGRDVLRTGFTQRSAEEKTDLVLKTEGRCLALLGGLPLDGHTTALLCRRSYVSTLLIQNIARWSAAPPPLIAHLLRQDAVRRNAQLRQMLERHPNANA